MGAQNIVWVFIGGGIGSVTRFLLSAFIQRTAGTGFPWGTLAVNLAGCFVIGALWSLSGRVALPFTISCFLFAGLLGGFTTMSSFGLEAFSLFHDGAWPLALTYVLTTTMVGFVLVAAGFHLSEFFLN